MYVKVSNKCDVFADVQTAVVAKEALEGHSIYEGGFCKLHISYSRHTDLTGKKDHRDLFARDPRSSL